MPHNPCSKTAEGAAPLLEKLLPCVVHGVRPGSGRGGPQPPHGGAGASLRSSVSDSDDNVPLAVGDDGLNLTASCGWSVGVAGWGVGVAGCSCMSIVGVGVGVGVNHVVGDDGMVVRERAGEGSACEQ